MHQCMTWNSAASVIALARVPTTSAIVPSLQAVFSVMCLIVEPQRIRNPLREKSFAEAEMNVRLGGGLIILK